MWLSQSKGTENTLPFAAFSYFVLKTRAREGRRCSRVWREELKKRGRACPKRGGRVHWIPCENFPLLRMVLIKSRYSSILLWVRGGSWGGDMYVYMHVYMYVWCGCVYFPGGPSGNEPACQRTRLKRRGFDPWVGKIPWRRKWQPTQVVWLENTMGRGAWRAP